MEDNRKIQPTGQLVEFLHRRADVRGTPLSGTFELTPMCNMACEMCYVRKTPEEVQATGNRLRTVEEWISMAEELKEQGTLLLLLTGGEPLTYPRFRELYEKLQRMGFVLSINSNATLIDEEMVDWFAHHAPQRINITLYGASDETYARLCHNPKGYTQARHAIEMLQDRGINVKLNCSVTPHNIGDLEEIIRYSEERKLILQATSYMFPPLRRDAESIGKNDRFSPEECARIEARIRKMQRGIENLQGYYDNVRQYKPLEDDNCFDCEGDGVRCRAGKSSFWITWDGRLLLCAMMDDPAYYPFEEGFAASWKKLLERTRQIRLPAECAACEAKDVCRSCAAMVYTETGCYDKKPQYRCDLMQATPKACLEVLEDDSVPAYVPETSEKVQD